MLVQCKNTFVECFLTPSQAFYIDSEQTQSITFLQIYWLHSTLTMIHKKGFNNWLLQILINSSDTINH